MAFALATTALPLALQFGSTMARPWLSTEAQLSQLSQLRRSDHQPLHLVLDGADLTREIAPLVRLAELALSFFSGDFLRSSFQNDSVQHTVIDAAITGRETPHARPRAVLEATNTCGMS